MAIIAPTMGTKKDYPLVPTGTHPAIMYRLMNLGSRLQEYMGTVKDHKDTLVTFTFEVPTETHEFTYKNEDGTEEKVEKPLVISKEFTLSMGPKSNLRPFVEGIIGVKLTDDEAYAFDLEQLVGKKCLISVTHKLSKDGTRTYANIASTSPLMKGQEVPDAYNKHEIFDVNTCTLEAVEALPQFLRDKVIISDEYKKRFASPAGVVTDADVPF